MTRTAATTKSGKTTKIATTQDGRLEGESENWQLAEGWSRTKDDSETGIRRRRQNEDRGACIPPGVNPAPHLAWLPGEKIRRPAA